MFAFYLECLTAEPKLNVSGVIPYFCWMVCSQNMFGSSGSIKAINCNIPDRIKISRSNIGSSGVNIELLRQSGQVSITDLRINLYAMFSNSIVQRDLIEMYSDTHIHKQKGLLNMRSINVWSTSRSYTSNDNHTSPPKNSYFSFLTRESVFNAYAAPTHTQKHTHTLPSTTVYSPVSVCPLPVFPLTHTVVTLARKLWERYAWQSLFLLNWQSVCCLQSLHVCVWEGGRGREIVRK